MSGDPTLEAVVPDPDYANRKGYDADFLGSGPHSVPLPVLPDDLVAQASVNSLPSAGPDYVIPYNHFSVVVNGPRRIAFFTAVNVDGASSMRLKREKDRWFVDPRIPAEEQTDESVYKNNPLDRGHLVRRLDPAWGTSREEAKLCNDDTFHFTNCSPQHEDFNQNQTTWAGLEDYVLENADNLNFRVTVFTGPVFEANDDQFAGVQLPREFWKVVAMVKESGDLSATAYLLSQAELIAGLEVMPEEFSYGAYRTYQVPVRKIEERTRVSFGTLANFDPLGSLEAASAGEIRDFDEIRL